jgi:16S rRNA (cytidine1402-2'-O)-methyltransferase
MKGTLYVLATPIGNLEDITLRGIRILRECDAVCCEDTRVTSHLLTKLEIDKPTLSIHEHSVASSVDRVVSRIEAGEMLVYVSDAGTPGVNDPGGKLVEACVARGVTVVPLPGASALTTAISACGFPMDEFTYVGFIPHKKGRETMFKEMAEREVPTVALESTHRIEKTLDALAKTLDASRPIFLARELTKIHETLYYGTVDEVRAKLHTTSTKGEFVLIIGPR